jgi:hypothetical protein
MAKKDKDLALEHQEALVPIAQWMSDLMVEVAADRPVDEIRKDPKIKKMKVVSDHLQHSINHLGQLVSDGILE